MALMSCKEFIDCEGTDFPITNYSSEGPERPPDFCSVVFPTGWDKGGCMTVCCLPESQNAADLCALSQESECPPNPDPCLFPPCDPAPRFCNVARTCECGFEGTTQFSFTIPPGTFCASTQEAADALANAYACALCSNPTTSIQIIGTDACTCLDHPYSSQIEYTGIPPATWIIIAGSLPDGLTLNYLTGRITGTPTMAGMYSFTVRAFTSSGNHATRTLSITVLAVSTTALDDIELGVPYSFQLTATGGSGNYAWRLAGGTMPTGLTLSAGGLISGTPTALGTSAVGFYVIDLACEGINRSFFTPQARVTGRSRTTIAEVKGFEEFYPFISTPPKKYMVRTYGTSMTGNDAAGNPVVPDMAASAYFRAYRALGPTIFDLATWYVTASGNDAINAAGQSISQATLQLYTSCPGGTFAPLAISPSDPPYQYVIRGWCFPFYQCYAPGEGPENLPDGTVVGLPIDCAAAGLPAPSIICSTCSDPAVASPGASLLEFTGNGTVSTAPYNGRPVFTSSTHGESYQDGGDVLGIFGNLTYIPTQSNLGYPTLTDGSFAGEIFYKSAWTVDLSAEYTDALALANATVYTSNGLVAQSKPRTTGFISTWTTVDYTVHCTNLLDGEDYVVIVHLQGDDGSMTTIPYTFTAVGTTHQITAAVPVPADGHSTIVRGATINYYS